jgi:itaconate CoA-transferase
VIAPYDAYPTADGTDVLIGIQNDRGWVRLVTDVLGRPELADDPEFATNLARVRNRAQVDAAVAAGTKAFAAEELIRKLDAAGIASARLNTVRQLIEHPQLSERDRWRTVGTPVGPIQAVLPPATFADAEARMDPVPAHGQHTAAVLAELGYGKAAIAGLAERGVVFAG